MNGIKNAFEKLGIFIEKNTLLIFVAMVLLIILSIQNAQLIEMKSGTETFVEKNSPLYQEFDHLYLANFGTDSFAVMVEGDEVLEMDVLKAIERLEKLVSPMQGVIGISSTAAVIKEANMEKTGRYRIPESDSEIIRLSETILPQKLATILPDRTHSIMFVEMKGDTSEEMKQEILRETKKATYLAGFPPGYEVIVTGNSAFDIAMQREMSTSMAPLLVISAFLMVIVLLIVFTHVRFKLLPLGIVLLGIIYTFGAMGYLKIPMSMVSMSAFPVLIGLGIDYAIQFHNRIEEELGKGECEEAAIINTIKHTGPAVLIAVTITSLGFVSLFTSTVPMIQDFGKLILIGVIMCFLASLFIGVAVLYRLDALQKLGIRQMLQGKKIRRAGCGDEKDDDTLSNSPNMSNTQGISGISSIPSAPPGKLDLLINKSVGISVKHPFIVLLIASLLCIGGLYVDNFVPIQTDVQTFVPQDMPAKLELGHLFDVIGGTDALNLIVKVDDYRDPEILQWVDEFSEHEANRPHIYGTSSIVDAIKLKNGGNIPDNEWDIIRILDALPESQKKRFVYGNDMLLINLEMGDAVGDIGLTGIEEVIAIVEEDLQWIAPPPGVAVTITGNSVAFSTVITALTSGRVAMTLLGLVLVFFGLLVIYRDLVKAATPVITMAMVIGWSGGIMYYLGLEYTPMTATLGALILGVGSEYAILMMERYFEERDNGLDPFEAMDKAGITIGKAIAASGLTTVFGFSSLMASPFSINSNFGLVTVLDVILALIATFLVFPAVVVYLDLWRIRYKDKTRRRKNTGNRMNVIGKLNNNYNNSSDNHNDHNNHNTDLHRSNINSSNHNNMTNMPNITMQQESAL